METKTVPIITAEQQEGVIFDIKEMAVFDGPGIRTTVFFKGCPLRCQWCHNPEGLSIEPQLMVSHSSCTHCGRCEAACPTPTGCTACGQCVTVCPLGLRRICGSRTTAGQLAGTLLRDADYLRSVGGGYTISGGEPTFQPAFLLALLGLLRGNHRAVETSGFCAGEVFSALLEEVELVLLDIKLVDAARHRRYIGQDNGPILTNLGRLKASGKPFIARLPLIPGVNDDEENLRATAALLTDAPGLQTVELLPYHKTAGAKYAMVGQQYQPDFDTAQPVNADIRPFTDAGLSCTIL